MLILIAAFVAVAILAVKLVEREGRKPPEIMTEDDYIDSRGF